MSVACVEMRNKEYSGRGTKREMSTGTELEKDWGAGLFIGRWHPGPGARHSA